MKYLSIVVALAVSACSGVPIKELRSEPPHKSAIYKTNYSELGNCVLDRLTTEPPSAWTTSTGNLQYETVDRKNKGIMTITGSMVSHYKIPIIDLVFIATSEGTSSEIRAGGVNGGPRFAGERVADQAWTHVQSCAE